MIYFTDFVRSDSEYTTFQTQCQCTCPITSLSLKGMSTSSISNIKQLVVFTQAFLNYLVTKVCVLATVKMVYKSIITQETIFIFNISFL